MPTPVQQMSDDEFNSLLPSPKKIDNPQGFPEGGDNLGSMLMQSLGGAGMGGIQGATLGAAGGPIGAGIGGILGAGLGAVMPPQTKADWATEALATALPAGRIEKAISEIPHIGGRFLARGATSIGENLLMDKVRSLLGDTQERNIDLPRGATSAIYPLLGLLGDKAAARVAVPQLQQKVEQGAAELQPGISNAQSYVRPTLNDIQAQFISQQARATTDKVSLGQAQKQLQKLNNEQNNILTSTTYSQPGDSIYQQALLAKNASDRRKFLKLTGVDPNMNPVRGSNGKFVSSPMAQSVKDISAIQESQNNLNLVNKGINPFDQTQRLSRDEQKALAEKFNDDIEDRKMAIWSGKEQEIRATAEQNAQANKQWDTNNRSIQRLQTTIDGLHKEITDNPFENVQLRSLLSTNNGQPFTAQQFIGNIEGGSAEHIDALYKYLGQQKNGESQIQTVRDAAIQNLFDKAYDNKTQNPVGKLPDLIKAGGSYNVDKLEALYGGGQDGIEAVGKFKQLTNDLNALNTARSLQNSAGSNHSLFRGGLGGGILFELGAHGIAPSLTTPLGIGTLGVIGMSKLTDWVVSNPKAAAAFHTFAQNGGTAAALRAQPLLENWLEHNAAKK